MKVKAVMIEVAYSFAYLSKCKRLQVGVVLTRGKRIIACGYNGTIKGTRNKCECSDGSTNEFVLHAEQNLLTFCNREGIKTKGASIYMTHSPCKTCSKLLASAGIKSIIYVEKYRDEEGIRYIKNLGIKISQYIPKDAHKRININN